MRAPEAGEAAEAFPAEAAEAGEAVLPAAEADTDSDQKKAPAEKAGAFHVAVIEGEMIE